MIKAIDHTLTTYTVYNTHTHTHCSDWAVNIMLTILAFTRKPNQNQVSLRERGDRPGRSFARVKSVESLAT